MALLWHERSRKFQQSQGKLPTLCTDGQVFVNINGDFWKEREKAVEQLDGLEYDREQKWERPVVLVTPTGRSSITLGQSVE